MQVKKVLVVSHHHANAAEQEKGAAGESFGPILADAKLAGWLLENAGTLGHRSWVVKVAPDILKRDLSELSTGLQEVIRCAINHGCTYIRFDFTEEPDAGFTDYRH